MSKHNNKHKDNEEVVDPRRRKERMDFEMIHEDHNAIANMPTEFINTEFKSDSKKL